MILREGIQHIGYQAFDSVVIQSVTFPKSLISIGQMAFYNTHIVTLEFPLGNLTTIGKEAFAYATNISEVVIPICVKVIERKAFAMCHHLNDATILNCETLWYDDTFLSTEHKVSIECVATKRFTMPFSMEKSRCRMSSLLFGLIAMSHTSNVAGTVGQ